MSLSICRVRRRNCCSVLGRPLAWGVARFSFEGKQMGWVGSRMKESWSGLEEKIGWAGNSHLEGKMGLLEGVRPEIGLGHWKSTLVN